MSGSCYRGWLHAVACLLVVGVAVVGMCMWPVGGIHVNLYSQACCGVGWRMHSAEPDGHELADRLPADSSVAAAAAVS